MCSHQIKRKKYDRYQFYKILSKSLKKKLEECCWIYDLETTNLISEEMNVKIMEIHVEELTTGIIPISSLIQIDDHKYDEDVIENLNGLTREMCNEYGISEEILIKKLNKLIDLSEGYFVAHNGNMFDHKIIRNLIQKDFKTLDTMSIIPLFCNGKITSKKLSSLYETIIGHPYQGLIHRAEADVKMMIEILNKIGLNSKILNSISK